jgi:hypothetical protein
MRTPFTPHALIATCNLLLPIVLLCALAPDAWAQRINLHFGANPYAVSTETTPPTPAGPAGTWNNLTNATANGLDSFESDAAAILYSDGSPGPTLVFDSTSGSGSVWSGTTLSTATMDYTTAGGVYNVANLYESGLQNAGNNTTGLRLKGLAAGTRKVYLVPMFRSAQAAGVKVDAAVTFSIGLGNDTDARNAGNFTLTSTAASPTQNIETLLTSWVAATDGSAAYNYQGLASTNVALPQSNWTGVAAHAFDPAGNFNSTNPVLPAAAQQFFRLLAGGTDAPPVAVGPSITTQPAPQTVSVGRTATFSVIASGKQHKLWRVDEGFRKVRLRQGVNHVLIRVENGHSQSEFLLALYAALP